VDGTFAKLVTFILNMTLFVPGRLANGNPVVASEAGGKSLERCSGWPGGVF